MPFIPAGFTNITWVIQRAGDDAPYTTSIGADFNLTTFDTAAADTLAAALGAASVPNLSSADTLVSIDYDYNEGAGVLTYSSPRGTLGGGDGISSTLPQNTAALLVKRTGTPGRKGRGRMYWPYVGDSDVNGVGQWSSGIDARYNTMCNAWKTAVIASPFFGSLQLFHTISTPAPSPILSLAVSPVVASQRRRLRR